MIKFSAEPSQKGQPVEEEKKLLAVPSIMASLFWMEKIEKLLAGQVQGQPFEMNL